jgi:hypothetical protein
MTISEPVRSLDTHELMPAIFTASSEGALIPHHNRGLFFLQ